MKPNLLRQRAAFTLVELLVVIAIIGVLVALLLPAVQAARESARRTQCINNMKQLGIALHNHHDTMGIFPASHDTIPNPNGTNWDHGWVVRILPFIEQQNLYERYRFDLDWDAGANDAAGGPIKQHIPGLLCPSAPGKNNRSQGQNRGILDYAATTERTWTNSFVSAAQAPFVKDSDPHFIGVLGHNKVSNKQPLLARRRFADITDGTTNTFLLGECAGRNRLFHNKKDIGTTTRGPWANPNSRINVGGCDPSDKNAATGPRAVNCINDKELYAFHPAGANVCMADASVRFIKESASLDLILALLTRGRGETIPGDF